MNMIRCALLSLRMRKACDGPLVIGEDLMSFAVSYIVESHEASGAPLKAN
jgi:hypothetical protein